MSHASGSAAGSVLKADRGALIGAWTGIFLLQRSKRGAEPLHNEQFAIAPLTSYADSELLANHAISYAPACR